MKLRLTLFILSLISFALFTIFSYSVAKEAWQQIDFDTTVKLQDHILRKYDYFFSYFSLLGSVEVTLAITGMMMFLNLLRLKIWAILGLFLIVPASLMEIFGKLFIFHPGPPVLFHRSIIETQLPSFYIHTNFSYPSGHMTRAIFLITVFCILALRYKNHFLKLLSLVFLISLAGMMFMTRIYLGEHWLSDVLGGSILGLSAGLLASVLVIPKQIKR